MYYTVDTPKSFDQAAVDLEAAVIRNEFGVLFVHDLGNTMRNKGLDFAEQLRVFEVCNPKYAHRVLGMDMRLNMALPCRISVWTEHGQTKLGMIPPEQMISMLSNDAEIHAVAKEVEAKTRQMIDEAK